MHHPLRLTCTKDALISNWSWLRAKSGASCGAAVKADAYGLGAQEVVKHLSSAGCREFFVSTWHEAAEVGSVAPDGSLVVLHGVGPNDLHAAASSPARPVLNTARQLAHWKEVAPERSCDVMIDTGMNRLGLRPDEAGALEGVRIHTLHSHLACADETHDVNQQQLGRFREAAATIKAERYSLANSAGILLGAEYSFDLVRPGLALYGGIPRPEARGFIHQVAQIEAQVVQRRTIRAGESCGYGAMFVADADTEAAIVNIGYADGYWRGFSALGSACYRGAALSVLGRISMDLTALGCDEAPHLAEGDWVTLDFELEEAARRSGKSQYELLTGLGRRFERRWQ